MIRIFLFSFLLLSIWIVPLAVLAQEGPIEYKPLVELPINFGGGGGGADDEPTTEDYVRILYTLSITVAALLAVVKIIFGGVRYMLTDVVTIKGSAKQDIQGALLGLLIVVGAVLILETINPQITQLNLLGNAPGININLGDHRRNDIYTQCPDGQILQRVVVGEDERTDNRCVDEAEDTTVVENPEDPDSIFDGGLTITNAVRRDLERGGVLGNLGIDQNNFQERVAGSVTVDANLIDTQGGVTEYQGENIDPYCTEGQVVASRRNTSTDQTYTFYCVRR